MRMLADIQPIEQRRTAWAETNHLIKRIQQGLPHLLGATPPAEIYLERRALIREGTLPQPDLRPGAVAIAQPVPRVASLFAQGTTDSNAIQFVSQTAPAAAATTVAEGQPKPETALTFTTITETLSKVACWLPVTDEALDDLSWLESFINSQLRLAVELELDDQVVNGNGTAPNLRGILNRTGLTPGSTTGTQLERLLKAISDIATSAYLQPDAIVMNPADWGTILGLKDTAGDFLAGDPFSMLPAPALWGVKVVVTPVITANTALVGAFNQGWPGRDARRRQPGRHEQPQRLLREEHHGDQGGAARGVACLPGRGVLQGGVDGRGAGSGSREREAIRRTRTLNPASVVAPQAPAAFCRSWHRGRRRTSPGIGSEVGGERGVGSGPRPVRPLRSVPATSWRRRTSTCVSSPISRWPPGQPGRSRTRDQAPGWFWLRTINGRRSAEKM
jgi:Phage capsid family